MFEYTMKESQEISIQLFNQLGILVDKVNIQLKEG
jgi:hypothetical protein